VSRSNDISPKTPVFAHGNTFEDAASRRQEGTHGIGERRRKIDGADKATGRRIGRGAHCAT